MITSCLSVASRVAGLLFALMLLTGCRELSEWPTEDKQPVLGEKMSIPTQPNPHAIGFGPMPGDPEAIVAYLNRPERALRGAVVLLHGCQGLDLGTRLAMVGWNEWWKAYGFATLVVDSLGPRQVDQACIGEDQQEKADLANRIRDAIVAAQYLQRTLGLPPERIGVQGFSHGGQTALELARATSPAFGWVIALYPGCTGEDPVERPTLILTGEGDDWTGADYCQDMAQRDARLKLVVLPHARHLFDQPLPERLAYGHVVAYDPEALNRAKRTMRHFLRDLGALALAR